MIKILASSKFADKIQKKEAFERVKIGGGSVSMMDVLLLCVTNTVQQQMIVVHIPMGF